MSTESIRAALHSSLDEALNSASSEAGTLRLQLGAAIAERDEALANLAFSEGTAGTLRSRAEELGAQADEWRDRANELRGQVEDLKEICRQNELTIAHKNARLVEIAGEIMNDQSAPDETPHS